MKRIPTSRLALSISATALLAACGGSQAPVSAPGAMLRMHDAVPVSLARSWMLPQAKNSKLIYLALTDDVFVFTPKGKKVGDISLVEEPGICSDTQGDVWITSGSQISEFAHGGSSPIAEVEAPHGEQGVSCAVDPSTGNLAVTLYNYSSSSGEVAVFTNASGTPQMFTDSDLRYYEYCTYDASGNLYVDGSGSSGIKLAELPSDGSTLTTVALDQKIGAIGGVQWNGQYLALGDTRNHVVYQFAISDYQGTTETTTSFDGWGAKSKVRVQFWIHDGIIGFMDARHFRTWSFPEGGRALSGFKFQYATTGGAALSIVNDR